MPNTNHAKKALRQSTERRLRNRSQRSALRGVIKKYHATLSGENPDAAQILFRQVVRRLDQAAAKGLIHKNKAARTKSRLSALLPKAPTSGS